MELLPMNLKDVVAMAFYLAGGRVEGLARLQAVMYMLHRETSLVNTYFETWWAVPWSEEVEQAVEELIRGGLLSTEVDEVAGVKTYVASRQLMERGAEVYRKIEERDPYVARLMKLVVAYGMSLSLSKLLLSIRLAYPDVARNGIQWMPLSCVARTP
ncbi:MAG: hypothetical protein ACO2PN_28020 [Pyrobaculum sp.]